MAAKTLKIDVHTPGGKKDGSVELPAELFDVEPNIALMHQVVDAQLAAARQGTHSTKTRGEVRGGGKKPYRQKGTGRARQGSTRAPQFTGGGVVHGPQAARLQPAHPEEDDRRRAARRAVGPGAQRPHPRRHRAGRGSDAVDQERQGVPGHADRAQAGAGRHRPQRRDRRARACATCLACTCSRRTSSTPTTCCRPTTWCSASRR